MAAAEEALNPTFLFLKSLIEDILTEMLTPSKSDCQLLIYSARKPKLLAVSKPEDQLYLIMPKWQKLIDRTHPAFLMSIEKK